MHKMLLKVVIKNKVVQIKNLRVDLDLFLPHGLLTKCINSRIDSSLRYVQNVTTFLLLMIPLKSYYFWGNHLKYLHPYWSNYVQFLGLGPDSTSLQTLGSNGNDTSNWVPSTPIGKLCWLLASACRPGPIPVVQAFGE